MITLLCLVRLETVYAQANGNTKVANKKPSEKNKEAIADALGITIRTLMSKIT